MGKILQLSLEKDFLKPQTQKTYPTLTLDNKTAKTNVDKAELFAESVERHFGIECMTKTITTRS